MPTSVLSERQKRILHVLRAKQSVSLKELSFQLHESDSTLRRELRTLADSGLVVRQSGKVSLAFAAGVENELLSYGSPNEIRHVAAENTAILAPGGGFLFASIHNIAPEVPPENIIALFEAGREYGNFSS